MFGLTSTEKYTPKPSSSVLEEYIREIAQGDTGSLAPLYQHTKHAVYGFALSILKNPQDAEDVLQETYLRIHQAACGYHSNGKPMSWIFAITRNLSLMKLREHSKTTDLTDQQWAQLPAKAPSVTDEDRILLQALMQLLTDQERQIVMLHTMSGLKHREIAQLLEIPLATVLSKYHRAIKKLKKHLEEG